VGICGHVRCTNPLKPGDFLCHMHREIQVEHRLLTLNYQRSGPWPSATPEYQKLKLSLRMERSRGLGLCWRCWKPATNPDARYPLCERHRRILNSQERCRNRKRKHWTRISIRTLLLKVQLPVP
jgi:hypothetical protein